MRASRDFEASCKSKSQASSNREMKRAFENERFFETPGVVGVRFVCTPLSLSDWLGPRIHRARVVQQLFCWKATSAELQLFDYLQEQAST